ncbi:hypothetical protein [Spirochaeta lutea]|uniref:Uncharacterized protein n=1 Tax=Spirochaeta lutea TaxID=1480694 RepID=A0A098R0H4_9SPIO|nr:hypothetical protein [Spirochaeta lutea]KGE73665.1 hypothetical protein DC28_01525 [Spirochaeta lutea]
MGLFFLALGVILTGCGSVPPDRVPVVRFIEILPSMLEEAEEKTREFWEDPQEGIRRKQEETQVAGFGMGTEPRVYYLQAGDEFQLNLNPLGADSAPTDPELAVLLTREGGYFELQHRLAMTNDGGNGSAISFDGLVWHMANGKKAPGEKPGEKPVILNWVIYDTPEPRFDQGPSGPVQSRANLQWDMYLNPAVTRDDAYWIWDSPQRPQGAMSRGMVFNARDKGEISYPLSERVVWFPKGARVRLAFNFISNLVTAETRGGITTFRVLRDFYVYPKGQQNVSVSFDGEDWANYFWSFRLEQIEDSRAVASDVVRYTVGLKLEYTGRK